MAQTRSQSMQNICQPVSCYRQKIGEFAGREIYSTSDRIVNLPQIKFWDFVALGIGVYEPNAGIAKSPVNFLSRVTMRNQCAKEKNWIKRYYYLYRLYGSAEKLEESQIQIKSMLSLSGKELLRSSSTAWALYREKWIVATQQERSGCIIQQEQSKLDDLSTADRTSFTHKRQGDNRIAYTESIKKRCLISTDDGDRDLEFRRAMRFTSRNQDQSDKSNQGNGRQLCSRLQLLKVQKQWRDTNTREQVEWQRKASKGLQLFRFAPEPNGYLHLGHAKAIYHNFETAKQLAGKCYLRFDDTNPITGSQKFMNNIVENVRWLGYEPYRITAASDYFQKIHEFAKILILKDLAYVCDLSPEDLHQHRLKRLDSPARGRSIEENISLFEEMKNGKYDDHRYVLRLKIDMKHQNPTMWDPVIYRIRKIKHPKVGYDWSIFPTYDFAHCICDSLEAITYSFCTLEFEIRRELYYWILNSLDLYKPFVWEYSRLNISHTLLSKRKIAKLITMKKIENWTDRRLMTLEALRRRGISKEAILNFISNASMARAGNSTHVVEYHCWENSVRKTLRPQARNLVVILEPIPLTIENLDPDTNVTIEAVQSGKANFVQKITKTIFIERQDVSLCPDDNYFGLSKGKTVALKYFGVIVCKEIQSLDGRINSVIAVLLTRDSEARKQEKGQLHWLSDVDSVRGDVSLYDTLFEIQKPESEPDFLERFNEQSHKRLQNALVQKSYNSHDESDTSNIFQFDRHGLFYLDVEETQQIQKPVFHQIVKHFMKKSVEVARNQEYQKEKNFEVQSQVQWAKAQKER